MATEQTSDWGKPPSQLLREKSTVKRSHTIRISQCVIGFLVEVSDLCTGIHQTYAFSALPEMLEWLAKELSDEAQS